MVGFLKNFSFHDYTDLQLAEAGDFTIFGIKQKFCVWKYIKSVMLNKRIESLLLICRIHINKQLEIEDDDQKPDVKADGKKRRRSSATRNTNEVDKREQVVVDPNSPPGVLMVEVDNVAHEEFQINEEVKVRT